MTFHDAFENGNLQTGDFVCCNDKVCQVLDTGPSTFILLIDNEKLEFFYSGLHAALVRYTANSVNLDYILTKEEYPEYYL